MGVEHVAPVCKMVLSFETDLWAGLARAGAGLRPRGQGIKDVWWWVPETCILTSRDKGIRD